MRYQRTFTPLIHDDLSFFEFDPDTPSEADQNLGDEAFVAAYEVAYLDVEHVELL